MDESKPKPKKLIIIIQIFSQNGLYSYRTTAQFITNLNEQYLSRIKYVQIDDFLLVGDMKIDIIDDEYNFYTTVTDYTGVTGSYRTRMYSGVNAEKNS